MCFLRRAIYGLKQSPRAWFAKLSGLLSSSGFTSCDVDPTVLIKKTHSDIVILVVYVDDILLVYVVYVEEIDCQDFSRSHVKKKHMKCHLSDLDLTLQMYFRQF